MVVSNIRNRDIPSILFHLFFLLLIIFRRLAIVLIELVRLQFVQELIFARYFRRFDEVFALFVLIDEASDVGLHFALQESASLDLLFQRLNLGIKFSDALVLLNQLRLDLKAQSVIRADLTYLFKSFLVLLDLPLHHQFLLLQHRLVGPRPHILP